jgi:glucan biosynthesis protein
MEPRSGNKAPVVLRCALNDEQEALTETWTYYWSPP